MTARPLPFLTLVRIALRTVFIQAGFSPEAMQTLGLLYALDPAWRYLYPDPKDRQDAVRRHLAPFNTHPYAAAALVGGILHYEARLSRGEASVEDVLRFKKTFMGPLAALGDGFYWLSLRPATGALSVALVPLIGVWAPLVFIVTYNLVHLFTRSWLFVRGYQLGSGVVTRLSQLQVPRWSNRLRSLTAAAAGVIGAWLALSLGGQGTRSDLGRGLAFLACGVAGVFLLERKVSPLALLYGAAALAVVTGALT